MTVPRPSHVVARIPTARSWLDLRGLQRTRGLSTLAVLASCVAHTTVCGCWVWWASQQALLAPSAGTPIAVTILETPPPPPAPEPESAPALLPPEPPEPPALPPPPEPLPAADPMPLEATPVVAIEPPAPAPVPPREEIAPPAPTPEPAPVAPGDDGASAAYWLQVRAEIARALRLPHTGNLSTSIAVRLAGAPDGFIVVAPPPGGDPLARSVRRAAEAVARRHGPTPAGTGAEAHWNIVIKPTENGIQP